ncbi:MAG: DEAD/DEAH box helicase [Mycobacterium leprae]
MSVTDLLGLPPAPGIFADMEWATDGDGPLTFMDLPAQDGPPPEPGTLYSPPGTELYPFQASGIQFLLEHPVALLGDEMGLGKSIQAIAALRLLLHREEIKACLILSPKSVLFDWYYKLRKWAPDLRTITVEGPKRRRTWYWQMKCHVHLAGYETWQRDLKEQLVDPSRYDLVILDEIQRVKNPETAIHQAVTRIDAPWRWGLSGTPLENRVDELLAIFAFLEPGLLPLSADYTPAVVRERVQPYVLRRRKVDVLQHLPPKEHRTVWLELTPEQRAAYEKAEQAGVGVLKELGRSIAPMRALALLTELKEICNLDPESGASCKMSFLEQDLAEVVRSGDKALVYSQFPEKSLKPLLPRFMPLSAALFDGDLSDWGRQLLIHRFQHKEQPKVLAMSLKCGGVGITLTAANHVYHFDHWWNPAVAEQAEDRVHRIGQQKPVRVTTILTKGTVEERIAELLERKRELFRSIMDPLTDMEAGAETNLKKLLSRSELLGLFGLQPGD